MRALLTDEPADDVIWSMRRTRATIHRLHPPPGGPSDELSSSCVIRDVDIMRSFFRDRLMLRSVVQALPLVPELSREAEDPEPAGTPGESHEWRTHPVIEMALRMQVTSWNGPARGR